MSFDGVESAVVSQKERSSPAGKNDCKHFGRSENCRQAMITSDGPRMLAKGILIKGNSGFLIVKPLTIFLVKAETRTLLFISRITKIFLWQVVNTYYECFTY